MFFAVNRSASVFIQCLHHLVPVCEQPHLACHHPLLGAAARFLNMERRIRSFVVHNGGIAQNNGDNGEPRRQGEEQNRFGLPGSAYRKTSCLS